MKVMIRRAKPEDLPELQRLGTELMVSERRFDPLFEEQWYNSEDGKKYLLKEIKGRNHICFIAEIKDKAVGYASCKLLSNETARPVKRAELDNLVVAKQYRGHGIGHKLVSEFKKWAKSKGAVKLKVIVNAHNADAIRFYKENSFDDYNYTMEANLE